MGTVLRSIVATSVLWTYGHNSPTLPTFHFFLNSLFPFNLICFVQESYEASVHLQSPGLLCSTSTHLLRANTHLPSLCPPSQHFSYLPWHFWVKKSIAFSWHCGLLSYLPLFYLGSNNLTMRNRKRRVLDWKTLGNLRLNLLVWALQWSPKAKCLSKYDADIAPREEGMKASYSFYVVSAFHYALINWTGRGASIYPSVAWPSSRSHSSRVHGLSLYPSTKSVEIHGKKPIDVPKYSHATSHGKPGKQSDSTHHL